MTAVDDIRAIQDVYPGVNVNISVLADCVMVSVHPLPDELFPERDTSDYPVGTYVVQGDSGAHLTAFRYADKDVDAALAAALAAVSGVSA